MAVNYDRYIDSKTTHYIANSGSDEHGESHGGAAGDQTGREWQLKPWYNRPWTVVLRYPNQTVALEILEIMNEQGWDAAWERYLAYTRQGGSDTFVGLVRNAGLRVPFDDGALDGSVRAAGDYIRAHLELL